MTYQPRSTLSVVLIAKNSEETLRDCLNSVQWADEIILLDSGSTDATVEIAQNLRAKVFVQPGWQGYGHQRQLAQEYATGDFIFMLDTDEQVTSELKESIKYILSQPQKPNTVFRCSRRNWFLGRYMFQCGWYPDKVIRLYLNKERTYNNNLVHESVDIGEAEVVDLTGDLLHETCNDYIRFQEKQLRYAKSWAEDHYQKGKKVSLTSAFSHSVAAFIKAYLIRKGFLEGAHGLLLSLVITQYTFNKYASLWSLNKHS